MEALIGDHDHSQHSEEHDDKDEESDEEESDSDKSSDLARSQSLSSHSKIEERQSKISISEKDSEPDAEEQDSQQKKEEEENAGKSIAEQVPVNRIDSIKDEKEAAISGGDQDQINAIASVGHQSVPKSVDRGEKGRLSKDHNRSNLTAVKVIKQGNSATKPNTAVNDFREKLRGELSTSPKLKHAADASYE